MSETDPWKVAKSTIRARIADYSVALLGHSSGSQQAKENAQTAIDVAIDAARAAEAAQLRGRSQVAMRDKPSPELMRALETLGKRPVQPPATPQEPDAPKRKRKLPCPGCVWEADHAGEAWPHASDCRVSLSSTPSPEGQTWQPIETAPKDGTRVLLFHHLWQAASTGQFYGSRQGWKLDSTLPPFTMQPIRWRHLPSPPTPEGTQP